MPFEQAVQLEDSWWKNVPAGQATIEEQKVTRVLSHTDISLRRRLNLTSVSNVILFWALGKGINELLEVRSEFPFILIGKYAFSKRPIMARTVACKRQTFLLAHGR